MQLYSLCVCKYITIFLQITENKNSILKLNFLNVAMTEEVTLPCRRATDDKFRGLILWERCTNSSSLLAKIWYSAQIGTAPGAGITPWERAAAWPVCVFSWVWTVPAIQTIKRRHFADLTFHIICKGTRKVKFSLRFIKNNKRKHI